VKPHVLDDAPLSGFHKRLALFAAGGPLLDGYILSSIGIALVAAGPALNLSSAMEGLVGAGALVGMLFGGAASGFLTDRFGRQVMYTLDLGLIAAISIAQFFVTEGWMLLVARLLIGAVVAADYPMASSLLTEFAPRRYRGPFLSGLVCMFFVGAAGAYFVGDAMMRLLGDDGWRWFLASAAVPALVLLILRLGTPESPRWLVSRGRHDEAQAVLTKVYGPDATVADIAVESAVKPTWRDLLRGGYLGRLIYVVTFYTCSNIPVFAIYTFGPDILAAFGMSGFSHNTGAALLEFLFLVGVVAALCVINKTGRRRMVIWGSLCAGLCLLVLGIAPGASPFIVVTAFAGFALFNGGPQVLTWVYPNELFPTAVRATAVGLITAFTRVGSAVGVFLVPLSLEHLGIGGTMIVAAALLLFAAGVSTVWAPETTGLSLDDASSVRGAGDPQASKAGAPATTSTTT
jgi:putative MFS transporter